MSIKPLYIAKLSGGILAGLFAIFLVGGVLVLLSPAPELPKYVRPGDFSLLPEPEVERLEALAKAGDAHAAGMLWGHYSFGVASKESLEVAEQWLRVAAENGSKSAQESLFSDNRWKVFPKDPARAIKFLEEAIAKGWPNASYELREMRRLPPPPPPKEESPFYERGYRR